MLWVLVHLLWIGCLFYTGVTSSVNVNGYLSSSFSLSRGVRQGCPLSPLLYVLVAEVLACNIRANSLITGLSLPGFSSALPCISQYADDTSLIWVLVLSLIFLNVKVFGLVLGMVESILLLIFLGLLLKSKCWVFLSVRVILKKLIGVLVLLLLKMSLFVATLWSSMPWPCLVFGMWRLCSCSFLGNL